MDWHSVLKPALLGPALLQLATFDHALAWVWQSGVCHLYCCKLY